MNKRDALVVLIRKSYFSPTIQKKKGNDKFFVILLLFSYRLNFLLQRKRSEFIVSNPIIFVSSHLPCCLIQLLHDDVFLFLLVEYVRFLGLFQSNHFEWFAMFRYQRSHVHFLLQFKKQKF